MLAPIPVIIPAREPGRFAFRIAVIGGFGSGVEANPEERILDEGGAFIGF